jgi:hypothetical protein
MNYEFGDRSDDGSRARRIRELFVAGTTIAEHAEYCVHQGVWSDSELMGMASIRARDEVRAALGELTPDGVPFAGPTPQRKGRKPIWRQMDFWSKRDFDYNYTAYKRREAANGHVAENIARVCRERFGENPVLLTGEDIEDEPIC